MFGKDVVRARSSLNACLATADHHFAVWQHLGKLVEPNQAGPWLTKFTVVCGTNAAPNVTKDTLALEGRSRLEIPRGI
eukprot:9235288-Pyramimonas_sp.AAC.1